MERERKVVIIGIDGATLNLMEPWMDAGKLPTFQMIRQKGGYGPLRSTIPHYSAPAWMSIITGCNPGKHGIYDFFRTDSVAKKLVSARLRRMPPVWSLLSDAGKHNIVVNVPGAYPPDPINGVMISGLMTPSFESDFTYPSEIKSELVSEKLGVFELEHVGVDDIPKNLCARYAPHRLAENVNKMTVSHATVAMNLMQSRQWDFAMVVFRGIDDAQHLLWDHPEYILSCYQKADEYVVKIMELFPDAVYIIVSDHGFYKPKKYLYVNNVLYNHGFLKTFMPPGKNSEALFLFVYEKVSGLLFHLLPLEKIVRSPFGKKIILSGGGNKNIDFSHSQAFYHSICSRGIRILLKGKYPEGSVDSLEYETVRAKLIHLFEELADPDTGEKIVEKVYRWEEVYGVDAVNDPLDVILVLKQGYGAQELLKQPEGAHSLFLSRTQALPFLSPPGFYDWGGDHAPDGVIFLYGDGIKAGVRIAASVMDVVPTVLAVLNTPVHDMIDGHVLQEAFDSPLSFTNVKFGGKTKGKSLLSGGELSKIQKLRSKIPVK